MFRSIVAKNIPCGIRVATYPISLTNNGFKFVRFNSTQNKAKAEQIKSSLDQLKSTDPLASSAAESKASTPSFEIDALLNRTIESDTTDIFQNSYGSRFDNNIEQTPRDIAKTFREFSMSAGRSVDVRYGNVGRGLQQLSGIMSNNKIFYLARRQKRHIRPALLRKLKKREWWRRKFAGDFHTLMQKINNAKRRGY
ncbi:uncharacterized protein SPAPADRAFT_59810 [Spathaspora passalidarum NRRL Y-27907]|uniref:Uncharacterized protein n=1 Tax=Spathaspora passalidarum (strain NRRL Y-27907 / 11-Y1) TaxID=619300 RepID=G3AI70_SPAPN|nr:uncharacterized protein SPAPADRAFT_59810 [Spathaspora passalidarum NRRL Y-27907]EGW34384.1 hypothetical protein SPAPADRAFT_59810 [Spathaspora passalidarum NRRL Y-27907]